jgi:hypothetical protein
MVNPLTDCCGGCLFFVPEERHRGECRRYAPRSSFVSEEVEGESEWPRVDDSDWCGEFERKGQWE